MSDPGGGAVEAGTTYTYRHPLCKYLSPLRTGIGLVTILVVWSSAVQSFLSISGFLTGIYLAIIGIPVFLLEAGYIIRLCCGVEGVCCRTFALILNFDGIRRGILYLFFAVFCFYPKTTEPSIISGIFLSLTGCLYVLKVIQLKKVATFVTEPAVQSAR